MSKLVNPSQLKILHVLTLNSSSGDYGGPLRVARELCAELGRTGHVTELFSGAIEHIESKSNFGTLESSVMVSPISKRFMFSSLWSWKLIGALNSRIRSFDVIHIHFGRELIPITAAILCILNRKKFVTQSHGMVIRDKRIIVKLLDIFVIVPIWKKSSINYVLSKQELLATNEVFINLKSRILPNGIAANTEEFDESDRDKSVVAFCARLHKSKGIDKFIALAEGQNDNKNAFHVFGPDGGELDTILEYMNSKKPSVNIVYKGALPPDRVLRQLSKVGLVVLPSSYDPFPMVILEALSVGTPVLVMPSCGFASTLAIFNADFVAESESLEGLVTTFNRLKLSFAKIEKKELIEFCEKYFSITAVCKTLTNDYRNIVVCDE